MSESEALFPDVGPPDHAVRRIVRTALEEDLPWGDVTSDALVRPDLVTAGRFMARENGVISGLNVARAVFTEIDSTIQWVAMVNDGHHVSDGQLLCEVRGSARCILMGERTALNLMQRMSGIATVTARYVEMVSGTGTTIVDTRKTVPGLRVLDKYAVRCGGGSNHRFSLSDGMLVKDNHLEAIGEDVVSLLRQARRTIPHTIAMEVEVDRLEQIEPAIAGGADIILLDNMTPVELRRAVEIVSGRARTEASGGITLAGVRAVAESGVDLISIGALTHSVRALDIGLDFTSVCA